MINAHELLTALFINLNLHVRTSRVDYDIRVLRNIAVLAMYIGMLVLIRMMSIVDMTWRNIAMSSSETQAYSAAEFLGKVCQ